MASADAAVKPETVEAASPRGDEPSDIVYPTVSPRTDPATLAAALDAALRTASGAFSCCRYAMPQPHRACPSPTMTQTRS